MIPKIKKFIEEVLFELDKVTWPTQPELINSTVVVIVFSIGFSIVIFVIDQVLARGMFALLSL